MNIQFPGVSRQALLKQFNKSPDSAPNTMVIRHDAAKPYRFDEQMERFTGQTAGDLVQEAQQDAAKVSKGAGARICAGALELGAGMLTLGTCLALPLIMLPAGLAGIYLGVTTLRHGADQIRQANYDHRFTQDVGRFAESAQHPAEQYNFAGGAPR